MEFSPPLIAATLCRRYKRFLADVTLDTPHPQAGETCTVHCPNTGAMAGLTIPGTRIWLSTSSRAGRKFPYTWELAEEEIKNGICYVGANPNNANRIVAQALCEKKIPELAAYTHIQPEVPYHRNSRVDFLLRQEGYPSCYLEVKNVHWRKGLTALFPDSVTTRGQKHMQDLAQMVKDGHRAVILYLIQRPDCKTFALADQIDPAYALIAEQAFQAGVEPLVYTCCLSPDGITWGHRLPFDRPTY